MEFSLRISVGSYEGSLFVLNASKKSKEEDSAISSDPELNLMAGFSCSIGALKSIAISETGRYE